MKKQFMFTPTSALFFALICLTFFSCQDEEVSDQLPFLSGTVEVPTQLICGDPVSIPIVDGENAEIGKVEIYNDLDNIYISVFSSGNWFLKGTNLFVGASAEIPLNTDGKANIDEFNYKFSHSPLIENHIVEISLDEINDCSTLALQVEAVELDESGNSLGETTGWLKGDLISDGAQGMKYQHCLGECVVKYPIDAVATFAFEDRAPQKGDADYNDFVVQMNSSQFYQGKQIEKLEMEFIAKARGASFDHSFLMRVPIEGNANVTIERFNSLEPNELIEMREIKNLSGENALIDIFPSTKEILTSPDHEHVNVRKGTTKGEFKLTRVTFTFAEGAKLLMNAPFDPILRVKNTESEIHILELTQKIDADGDGQKDYWEDEEGVHPFGIVMHNAWVWPLEEVYIKNVYPNYKFVIENGVFKPADPKWYETPQEGTDYFRPELFN
jgi:LruC domain-containing protein